MVRRPILLISSLCVVLVLSIIANITIGAVPLSLAEMGSALSAWIGVGSPSIIDETTWQIIAHIRLPRIFLGVLVGTALAVAGTAFQGIFRNPLSDPFTLGVASGASLGASLMFFLDVPYAWWGTWTVPIGAFIGAMATLWFVFVLVRRTPRNNIVTLVLAGIVVQAFLTAAVSCFIFAAGESASTIIFWMMGKLTLRGWSFVVWIAPLLLLSTIWLCFAGRSLNILSLGEREAFHLGMRIDRQRWKWLVLATFTTSVAVAIAGVIGFVGLLIPHLLRLIIGDDYKLLLPLSAVAGAIYVIWADALARTVVAPTELPLGVITALLGAPFFLFLLIKHQSSI